MVQHENHERAQWGLAPIEAKTKSKFVLSPDQQEVIRALPKKVGDYMRKLFKRGRDVEILKLAALGENPFRDDRERTYRLAFEHLLDGGFSKRSLRAAFMSELGWTEGAAFSEVSIVWRVLMTLGVAREEGCVLVPSDKVQARGQRGNYGYR